MNASAQNVFCQSCGMQMPTGSRFCSQCGLPAAATQEVATLAVVPPAPVQLANKRSYRWVIVVGWFVVTLLLWNIRDWALAIVASAIFWPLLLWAIIASAVASGVRRGRGI